jgi:hypothetical protein
MQNNHHDNISFPDKSPRQQNAVVTRDSPDKEIQGATESRGACHPRRQLLQRGSKADHGQTSFFRKRNVFPISIYSLKIF